MNTEYEIRVLEVDVEKLTQKLEALGAEKVGDWMQKRYVYDFTPKRENQWIRLRTNGKKTTLTYKNVEKNTIDGTKELEIVVEDFEKTNEMLEILGYKNKGYQENKRVRYILGKVEIDFDTWPRIPTYMEIEGKNEDLTIEERNILSSAYKSCVSSRRNAWRSIYGVEVKEKSNNLSKKPLLSINRTVTGKVMSKYIAYKRMK